ncbi:unnamed protein product, partial [Mesorhabditis belari]|uniref:K Homology domain-containing protein n=1 Tax=Mesorhabditis belari TaxID=2138241 RepID=A0AAF3FE01_9BILA
MINPYHPLHMGIIPPHLNGSTTGRNSASPKLDTEDPSAAMTAHGSASAADLASTPHSTNDLVPGVAGNGERYSVEYLSQLLKDKKQLAAFPNVFHHLERLADEEISKVRVALFQFEFNKGDLQLPEAEGEAQVFTERIFVPAKEHPDYNFVGRILGPRGMTAKQLEQETGCKIMVRGRGSMRDKKKEELNRGKPNWEHLNEELHVLIQVEDTQNRAKVKLQRAMDEIKKLLVPAPEGEDELKRKQLMELAIINGTYRSSSQQNAVVAAQLAAAKQTGLAAIQAAAIAQSQRALLPLQLAGAGGQIRSPGLAGAPIIMSPQTRQVATSQAASLALAQQQAALVATSQATGHDQAALMAHQAAFFQQQQAAVDYQQLLLGQQAALGYDAQTLQAMQYAQAQQQQLAAAAGGMLGQYIQTAEYSVQDLAGAAAQSAPGAMLQQRRLKRVLHSALNLSQRIFDN